MKKYFVCIFIVVVASICFAEELRKKTIASEFVGQNLYYTNTTGRAGLISVEVWGTFNSTTNCIVYLREATETKERIVGTALAATNSVSYVDGDAARTLENLAVLRVFVPSTGSATNQYRIETCERR